MKFATLFTEKTEAKRSKGRVFPMNDDEFDFLMSVAKSRGTSMVAVIRKSLRDTLVEPLLAEGADQHKPESKPEPNGSKRGKKNVEDRT